MLPRLFLLRLLLYTYTVFSLSTTIIVLCEWHGRLYEYADSSLGTLHEGGTVTEGGISCCGLGKYFECFWGVFVYVLWPLANPVSALVLRTKEKDGGLHYFHHDVYVGAQKLEVFYGRALVELVWPCGVFVFGRRWIGTQEKLMALQECLPGGGWTRREDAEERPLFVNLRNQADVMYG